MNIKVAAHTVTHLPNYIGPYDNAVEQQLSYDNAVEQLKDFLGGYHSYLVGPWTNLGFSIFRPEHI